MPRKYSSDVSSQGTGIVESGESSVAAIAAAAAVAALQQQQQQLQISTSIIPSNNMFPNSSLLTTAASNSGNIPSGYKKLNFFYILFYRTSIGSSTLPPMWNPQMASSSAVFTQQNQLNSTYVPNLGAFPSIQSLDTAAASAQPGYAFYTQVSKSFITN